MSAFVDSGAKAVFAELMWHLLSGMNVNKQRAAVTDADTTLQLKE